MELRENVLLVGVPNSKSSGFLLWPIDIKLFRDYDHLVFSSKWYIFYVPLVVFLRFIIVYPIVCNSSPTTPTLYSTKQ